MEGASSAPALRLLASELRVAHGMGYHKATKRRGTPTTYTRFVTRMGLTLTASNDPDLRQGPRLTKPDSNPLFGRKHHSETPPPVPPGPSPGVLQNVSRSGDCVTRHQKSCQQVFDQSQLQELIKLTVQIYSTLSLNLDGTANPSHGIIFRKESVLLQDSQTF